MIAHYSKVRLVTDRFSAENARKGMEGYVIEIYENGEVEVEFSNPSTGETLAQIVARESDLESV